MALFPPGTKPPLELPLKEPVPFERFMEHCLYDSRVGYYRRRSEEIFGRAGDYLTSPHTNPVFGHCLAEYFGRWFRALGKPDPFDIWELGAGDGRLSEQIRGRLEKTDPELFRSMRYLEIDVDRGVADHEMTGIVFSNEFFDALPVHRVRSTAEGLQEIWVDQDGNGFREVAGALSDPAIETYLAEAFPRLHEGWIYEVNLRMLEVVRELDSRIRRGVVLTLDYGYTPAEYESMPRPAGTLACYRRHGFSDDPYQHPGEQDMTCHVHWGMLVGIGRSLGWRDRDLMTQRQLLMGAGLAGELAREEASGWFSATRLEQRLGLKDLLIPGGVSDTVQALIQHVRSGNEPAGAS